MRLLVALFVAGCGTTTFIPADDGSASDAASEASDVDSGDPCKTMRLQIESAKAQLQQCQVSGSGGQCQQEVNDACCPFTTSSDNTMMFQALVNQYKTACKPLCPNQCPSPQKVCDMTGSCR